MCTRYFRNAKSDRKLAEWVELDYVMNKKLEDTRGDVRPTDLAPVVCVSQRGKLFLQWQKWGFNDMGNGRLVLNARAESVPEKRMFSECMETRRCLVPAAGFYEWNPAKEKFIFTPEKNKLFWMAGVYTWFEESYRFVVLTTAANESVSSVHERMPLILKDKDAMEWLMDDEKAKKLLKKVPGKLQKTAEYEQMVLPFVQ